MKSLRLSRLFIGAIFLINFAVNTLVGAVFLILMLLDLLNAAPVVLGIAYVLSVALLGTLLAAVVSRRLFSRFGELSGAMEKVAGGDYSVRLPEDNAPAELGDMTRSFNRMARELEGTELMRSDFISSVSHQFKTPLAAMEGYGALLGRDNLSTEERREYSQRLSSASRRLGRLTESILLLSRLESGSQAIERSPVRLDRQIRQCVLDLESAWSERSITPEAELEAVTVSGSADLLREVWTNLIDNAVKFSPEGGTVSLSLSEGPQGALFTVRDHGPGLSQEALSRAFEKFYRADKARTGAGNGLGLALVKDIVTCHGGTVSCENAPDGGAVFKVSLPI